MSQPNPARPRIYLDYNATCPPSARVAQAVHDALLLGGNPSTPYREGRAARSVLEASRERIAGALGAEPLDLVFCSGGTEANHLGLAGLARAKRAKEPGRHRILLPPTVHASLLAVGQSLVREGFQFEELPVSSCGHIDLDALVSLGDVAVLGFSLVNHELGTVQQIAPLAERAALGGFFLFCDGVQALAKMPLDVTILGVDGMSVSAHKIGGPQGIGGLWLAPGPDLGALFGGGKQEGGRRPGTQATALTAGFAAAMEEVGSIGAERSRLEPLAARLRAGFTALGATLHSDDDCSRTLSSTLSARFPGVLGDVLVASLDLAGIAISTGAACSSGMATPSSGLLGIGLSAEQALEAIRVSMGSSTRAEDIEVLLELLPGILERAKRFPQRDPRPCPP